MDGSAMNEIERPRSIFELLEATISLYQRFPWLFLALAAVVVVPFDLIVLAVTGAGPQTRREAGAGTELLLFLLDFTLVGPLISALHVHGALDVRDGKRPQLTMVARRALPALPVVSAAVIISSLGIGLGFIALIVPGVLLWLRWSVVAQAAAIEDGGWGDALKRSRSLTKTHYLHILGLFLLAAVIVGVPSYLLSIPFRHSDTTAVSFVVGTAANVVFSSFTALTTALLYFDLRARSQIETESPAPTPPDSPDPQSISGRTVDPTGHPCDPDSYSDEDRPFGWYVQPEKPWRMRYWSGEAGWSERTAKTPKKTQDGWYKVNDG